MKLFAAGDLVNSKGNQHFVGPSLRAVIDDCELAICNFEAPIGFEGMEEIPKVGPHVYQAKESIQYAKEAGFNMVSLANNHIFDFGEKALNNTMAELEKHKVDFVGSGRYFMDAYSASIWEQDGVKVGVLAACENEFGCLYEDQQRAGYAWIFHPLIEDEIRALKEKVDAIVMVVHAGAENVSFPIKEWRDRYQRLCDVGVDVVIGHHPHVPQGYEKYKNAIIFYSLGNFYFDSHGHDKHSNDSYSVVLDIKQTGLVGFELVYHKLINNQTCLVDKSDVDFSIEKLNSYLEEGYIKRNNELCVDLYHKYYYKYYVDALGGKQKNISKLKALKTRIRMAFFVGDHKKNLLLLHNIRIDTHRFVVQRALSLLSENNH